MKSDVDFRPVILAGGSGTRFWPRSRKANAKQILALDGERSMIQQTVDRLSPIAKDENIWIVTNDLLAEKIAGQLSHVAPERILREPVARNTAPAAGLTAFILERQAPHAVIGLFPSDHVIGDVEAFQRVIRQGIKLAAAGENIVVLGIHPTRPERGYGYIEGGNAVSSGVFRVRHFTEKPDRQHAEEFLAKGDYSWNSGIFLWTASTLTKAVREYLPETATYLAKIAEAYGTPEFGRVFAQHYPKCENISLDYAILEPSSAMGEQESNVYCIPAKFGWNDLGSWAALYQHRLQSGADEFANVLESGSTLVRDSQRNYVYAPGKCVALVGVDDLVIVETADALLVTTHARSQDIGKLVKDLQQRGDDHLT
jgi:mannose-1-phosphate guanylyltransferase